MSQSAQDYLDDQAGQGQFHSEGQFSLDPQKALEKMRRYQFSSPWKYLDLIVQAAVLRQATWVALGPTVEIGCRPLTREEFEFLTAPPDRCPPDILRICMAIEAARRLGQLMIRRIEIHSAGMFLNIGLDGQREQIQVLTDEPDDDSSPKGISFKLIEQIWSGPLLAALHIRKVVGQFRYCGIPVYSFKQRALLYGHLRGLMPSPDEAGQLDVHHCQLSHYPAAPGYREVYFAASQWRPDLIPVPASMESKNQRWWVFEEPNQPVRNFYNPISRPGQVPWLKIGGFAATGCFAYFVRGGYHSEIEWIKSGVVISKTVLTSERFPAGWLGAVWADDLPTDLSGANVVDGDLLRQRLHWLQAHLNIP